MSDGNAQEAQSLYVRQCIIHAFKRQSLCRKVKNNILLTAQPWAERGSCSAIGLFIFRAVV